MNEIMIERWNEVVGPEDVVWHLGDVSICNMAKTAAILARLNGKICLVRGNHDSRSRCERLGRFETIRESCTIAGRGEAPGGPWAPIGAFLRHAPDYTGAWPPGVKIQLAGHIHERWAFCQRQDGRMIVNVGVDQWDFRPVSMHQILKRMEEVPDEEIYIAQKTDDDSRGLPSHYGEPKRPIDMQKVL